MMRRAWPLALGLAALIGCNGEETDPNKINNDITGVAAGKGPVNDSGNPVEGGAAGQRAGGAFTAKDVPKGYPVPEGTTAPGAEPAAKPAPEGAAPAADAPKADAPKADAPQAAVELKPEEIAEIKKLPAEQAEVALKQKVCPVSNEPLGSMGAPIKVEAEGKTAYLCCKGCQGEFDKDPKAVLTKLGLLSK